LHPSPQAASQGNMLRSCSLRPSAAAGFTAFTWAALLLLAPLRWVEGMRVAGPNETGTASMARRQGLFTVPHPVPTEWRGAMSAKPLPASLEAPPIAAGRPTAETLQRLFGDAPPRHTTQQGTAPGPLSDAPAPTYLATSPRSWRAESFDSVGSQATDDGEGGATASNGRREACRKLDSLCAQGSDEKACNARRMLCGGPRLGIGARYFGGPGEVPLPGSGSFAENRQVCRLLDAECSKEPSSQACFASLYLCHARLRRRDGVSSSTERQAVQGTSNF